MDERPIYVGPRERREIPRLREAQLIARANGDEASDAALTEAINGELDEVLTASEFMRRSFEGH